jgi:hypothetical protein
VRSCVRKALMTRHGFTQEKQLDSPAQRVHT